MLLLCNDEMTLTLKGQLHISFQETEVIPNILIKKKFNTEEFTHTM